MPAQEAEDTDAEISAERAHLRRSREALARMRENVLSLDASAAGDWVSAQVLSADLAKRAEALRDDPTTALFFGRLDYPDERLYVGRRHVHDDGGEPSSSTGGRRCRGRSTRRARPTRWACAAPPVRLLRRRADRVRGRGLLRARPSRGCYRGDRAPARRPDARHRRHDPARAGRHRPRRRRPHAVRPGRARHRKDRRRPAPGRLSPVRAPGADAPGRRARHRAQRVVPRLHPRRAARARRGNVKQQTLDELLDAVPVKARDEPVAGAAQGRRPDGRGAAPRGLEPPARAVRGARPAARHPALAHPRVRDHRDWPRRCAPRGVRYGAGRDLLSIASRTPSCSAWSTPARPATTVHTSRPPHPPGEGDGRPAGRPSTRCAW